MHGDGLSSQKRAAVGSPPPPPFFLDVLFCCLQPDTPRSYRARALQFLAFMGIEVPDPATAEVSAAAEALSTVMTAAVVEGSQSLNQAGVLAGVALRKLLSTRR